MQKILSAALGIVKDYRESPLSMKIMLPVIILLSILVTSSCMNLGPSKEFVERQDANANALFPLVERLIESASKEFILKEEGISDISEENIQFLKDAYKKRFSSWAFLIKKELEILNGGK